MSSLTGQPKKEPSVVHTAPSHRSPIETFFKIPVDCFFCYRFASTRAAPTRKNRPWVHKYNINVISGGGHPVDCPPPLCFRHSDNIQGPTEQTVMTAPPPHAGFTRPTCRLPLLIQMRNCGSAPKSKQAAWVKTV
jgi:hypothetical protein